MPKVLILFCGGTIVMTESDNGALDVQDPVLAVAALKKIEPRIEEVAHLEVEYIDNIDSANMKPQHWDRISQAIYDKYPAYDGFIITHGTNSMGYTASALSFSLQNLGKPVVLTGAQIPCSRVDTDARRNFVNAVRVATMNLAGVYLIFDEEIIFGARASKVSESKLNAFETINWGLAGEIRIDIRLAADIPPRHFNPLVLKKGFEENIAVVTLLPGTPHYVLDTLLENGVKGVILKGYGPGDISYDYLPFIKAAANKKVPVVVTTQCLEGATAMHLNDVGRKALDGGAIQAYDMSLECCTTKLMWALHHYPYQKIAGVLHHSFVGEVNKEGRIY